MLAAYPGPCAGGTCPGYEATFITPVDYRYEAIIHSHLGRGWQAPFVLLPFGLGEGSPCLALEHTGAAGLLCILEGALSV